MNPTYILVDFENVQPPDLDLLRGEEFRVLVFHGPHQKKLDMSVVRALQPLGERVQYIQSEKAGKNALDFHIAFSIGRWLESHELNGKRARFVVVSGDSGFDSLLSHVRSLGYPTAQGISIRDALNGGTTVSESASPTQECGADAPQESNPHGARTSAMPADSMEAGAGSSSTVTSVLPSTAKAPNPAPAILDKAAKLAAKPANPSHTSPAKKPAAKAIKPLRNALGPEDRVKLINHLRASGNKRPASRKTLERHVVSHLGNDLTLQAAQKLITQLEGEGILKFDKSAVSYKLPKARKA